MENGCEVMAVIFDPADAQLLFYATVTRDGRLVGSFYCADVLRQRDWRIVTPDGNQLLPRDEGCAMLYLTEVLADSTTEAAPTPMPPR